MVKRRIVKEIVYECEGCGFGFSTKEAAEKCEKTDRTVMDELRKKPHSEATL